MNRNADRLLSPALLSTEEGREKGTGWVQCANGFGEISPRSPLPTRSSQGEEGDLEAALAKRAKRAKRCQNIFVIDRRIMYNTLCSRAISVWRTHMLCRTFFGRNCDDLVTLDRKCLKINYRPHALS